MWNFDAYFSNPPFTTLRAYGWVLSLILRPKTAACNNTQKRPSKNTQADIRKGTQCI